MDALLDIVKDDAKLTELVKPVFDEFDLDKSGAIEEKELVTVFSQIAKGFDQTPPTKEEIKELMKALDTDKSGKIELNEFKALFKMYIIEARNELYK